MLLKTLRLFSLLLACLLISDITQAQIGYKMKLRREARENSKSDQPIKLDPIEEVPQQTTKRFSAEAALNWGLTTFLPDSVNVELFQKARYPVTVKVFDTGSKYSHNWLSYAAAGRSYTGGVVKPDVHGHSTHVAGIIGGYKEQDRVGFCAALAQKGLLNLVPIQVLGDDGSGSFSWVDAAIKAEDTDNSRIINGGGYVVCNFSLGGGTAKLPSTEAALKASTDLGVKYVIATGNNAGPVSYPGNSQYVTACASLDQNLLISSYSNFGPETDFAAPGRSIYSTYKDGQFATLSGTSMATPALTSAVAITYSVWGPDAPKTVAELERYLAWCSTDISPAGKDVKSGWGAHYILKIIRTNPKTIPAGFPGGGGGGPIDPNPNPPTNPQLPKRETRIVSLDFAGPFTIVWSNQGAAGTEALNINKWAERKDYPDLPKVFTVTKNTPTAALNTLTITNLKISIKTDIQDDDVAEVLLPGVEGFFKNRGLLLNATDGFTEATKWSIYFLDMYLHNEKKVYDVDFTLATGTTQRKNSTTQTTFKKWPQ